MRPPLKINPDKAIPAISLLLEPPHAMRHRPLSPRPFMTPSDMVRMGAALSSLSAGSLDLKTLTTMQNALYQKKEHRITTYQLSGIDRAAYSALTHLAAEYRAYFLTRPVNQEAANARLLCMLLGTDLVTKAMDVKAKSSTKPFSGGFLRVQATQVSEPGLATLTARFPTLKHSATSFRLLEKSGEFYNIRLDVPLSFIFSLHAQSRIKDPTLEIEGDDSYLKVESNDKVGAIKWRCKLVKDSPVAEVSSPGSAASPVATARAASSSELHTRVPEWYYSLYYGSLPKEPLASDFRDSAAFTLAHTEYQQKLHYPALLASWQEKIGTIPSWFKALQAAHPHLGLTWNLEQLFNVTELQDGHYRDIVILGRTVSGRAVPLISDYDLFAVIPDRSMTDDEIWALQIAAGVLPEKQIHILRRHDGVSVTLSNLSEIFIDSGKLDPSKCFIDRALYFDTLIELGPLSATGSSIADTDPRVRYKRNTLTGSGSRAEGDLVALFNRLTAEYHAYYAKTEQENIATMRARSGISELEAGAGAGAGAGASARTRTADEAIAEATVCSLDTTRAAGGAGTAASEAVATSRSPERTSSALTESRSHYALSAHHGPETANPKPELLPWQSGIPLQGIFTCDPHGDFCQLCSTVDFIALAKAILEADQLYGTQHRIPLNGHWPVEFLTEVTRALTAEKVIIYYEEAFVRARPAHFHLSSLPSRAPAGSLPEVHSARSAESATTIASTLPTGRLDDALTGGGGSSTGASAHSAPAAGAGSARRTEEIAAEADSPVAVAATGLTAAASTEAVTASATAGERIFDAAPIAAATPSAIPPRVRSGASGGAESNINAVARSVAVAGAGSRGGPFMLASLSLAHTVATASATHFRTSELASHPLSGSLNKPATLHGSASTSALSAAAGGGLSATAGGGLRLFVSGRGLLPPLALTNARDSQAAGARV